MTGGQSFRWRRLDDARWAGVDGDTWWITEPLENQAGWNVRSNATAGVFDDYFRLQTNLREIKKRILVRGPELRPCLDSIRGLRVLKTSPEETFFTFLCTPNNNAERIGRMVRVLEGFGDAVDAPFDARRFPSARRIAAIPEDTLRSLGFGYRGKSIPAAAQQLLERGIGWLEGLSEADYATAHSELCRIRGIGPKLADCIALFGLGFGEAVPVDTHLWQSACRVYFPEWKGKSLTGLRYREIGDLFREKFGKLAGWAHQYLFYESFHRFRKSRGTV